MAEIIEKAKDFLPPPPDEVIRTGKELVAEAIEKNPTVLATSIIEDMGKTVEKVTSDLKGMVDKASSDVAEILRKAGV